MKPGKNFVIEFSTSAYELAKMEISKIIETIEFNATYNIRAQHGLDLSDITVDTCMKVFSGKKWGPWKSAQVYNELLPYYKYNDCQWRASGYLYKRNI
jgi:hypothetical protein